MTTSARCEHMRCAPAAISHGASSGAKPVSNCWVPRNILPRGVIPAAEARLPPPSLTSENLALRIDLGPFAHPQVVRPRRACAPGQPSPGVIPAAEARLPSPLSLTFDNPCLCIDLGAFVSPLGQSTKGGPRKGNDPRSRGEVHVRNPQVAHADGQPMSAERGRRAPLGRRSDQDAPPLSPSSSAPAKMSQVWCTGLCVRFP
jgi:hypothetical protein